MKLFVRMSSLFGLSCAALFKGKQVYMDESFKFRKDEYKGIHINTDNCTYQSEDVFKSQIEDFITKQNEKEGPISSVWVKLTQSNLHLAHVLNSLGFDIHHSED